MNVFVHDPIWGKGTGLHVGCNYVHAIEHVRNDDIHTNGRMARLIATPNTLVKHIYNLGTTILIGGAPHLKNTGPNW